ncbi:FAD linked oxidase domain-containing protein [Rutstroemia sp. NJR-2017a WRK4]|nr:FAD linked oxidase domain-containing protein [Rutstroemia sp. NJR-2017a WRK4]
MSVIPPEVITYTPQGIEKAVKALKSKKIPVYEPGQDDYERYVATANLVYRFSSPPCVVQPKCACDVREIIKIAKPLKIPITIKNGGHSFAGGSTTNVGILMELGLMNQVTLDGDKNGGNVTVQGGALWFHVYKKLISEPERRDGLVANGGRCPTVGVSGFILGGGLSPFSRSFGMGCDTVKEFTIVTAAGDEITVSDKDDKTTNKGKLFWALRGAGGGNFGVVVEMKMALQKLNSEYVVAGRHTWYPKSDETSMNAFMATMNSFYTRPWSNEMTIDSSWLCDLSKTNSELGVRFLVYYNGERKPFNEEIASWELDDVNEGHQELKTQLTQRSLEEKSSRFLHESLAAQWIEETKKSFPTNRTYHIYTSFVIKNDDKKKIIDMTNIIREEMNKFRDQFPGETGLLQVTFIHSGGAARQAAPDATAFRWREAVYYVYIMIQWDEKWLEYNMRTFLQTMKTRLHPFGIVPGATFINFPDDSLKRDACEISYYGANYEELRRVKQIWDQDNFFDWPQGVQLPKTVEGDKPEAGVTASNTVEADTPDVAALVVNTTDAEITVREGTQPSETNSSPLVTTFSNSEVIAKPSTPLRKIEIYRVPELNDHDLMAGIPASDFITKEQALTDAVANQQWESYRPMSTTVYGVEALPELVY